MAAVSKNVFLTRCLEVARDRLLQLGLVLLDHAPHAVKLLDPPSVGTRDIAREVGLLRINQILELVNRALP